VYIPQDGWSNPVPERSKGGPDAEQIGVLVATDVHVHVVAAVSSRTYAAAAASKHVAPG
jgi:hypothetical protein